MASKSASASASTFLFPDKSEEKVQLDEEKCGKIRRILNLPFELYEFTQRLNDKFGDKYMSLLFLIYGLNQGLGEGWFYPAQNYYLKDVVHVGPIGAQAYSAVAHIPWTIKPIYGILSDGFPLNGLHRTYYIVIASVIGTASWIILGTIPLLTGLAVFVMLLGNISLALPEVMVDAVNAEKSKIHPEYATDLQSFAYGSLALCGIIGTLSSGFLIIAIGSKALFALIALTSAPVGYAAYRKWLGEGKTVYVYRGSALTVAEEQSEDTNSTHLNHDSIEPDTDTLSFTHDREVLLKQRPYFNSSRFLCSYEVVMREGELVRLALITAFLVLIVAIVVIATENLIARFVVTVIVSVLIVYTVYFYLFEKYPIIAKATLFLFLREILQPNLDQAMFYWYTDADDGPHFSPAFVGVINTMAYIAMFIGIVIYNSCLVKISYRSIFISTQILLVFTNLLDVVFVMRWNLVLGIPDEVFVLGDATITPVVRRFSLMPMFVMASKLCPDGAEATLFSVMMSLSNFGYDVGTYFGSMLLALFKVTEDDYSGFAACVFIKSVMRILPVFLVPFLVPRGCPNDKPDTMLDAAAENSEKKNLLHMDPKDN